MCQIELSSDEQEVLNQILESSLASLEIEIRHTDHLEYKERLKRRRELLRGLVAKTESESRIRL